MSSSYLMNKLQQKGSHSPYRRCGWIDPPFLSWVFMLSRAWVQTSWDLSERETWKVNRKLQMPVFSLPLFIGSRLVLIHWANSWFNLALPSLDRRGRIFPLNIALISLWAGQFFTSPRGCFSSPGCTSVEMFRLIGCDCLTNYSWQKDNHQSRRPSGIVRCLKWKCQLIIFLSPESRGDAGSTTTPSVWADTRLWRSQSSRKENMRSVEPALYSLCTL